MKRNKIFSFVMMVCFIIVLTGCGTNKQLNSVGTSIDGDELKIETAAIRLGIALKEGGYQLVDTASLDGWIKEKKEMIIIDTMPADNFAKGHIPGAVNVELPKTGLADVTSAQKEAFIKSLGTNKDATIVIYCGFTSCERSHVGATIAIKEGFKKVYRLPGGSIAWKNAGYTEEK